MADGWFALLYAGEQESERHRVMVVAHMDEEQNAQLSALPAETTFELALEEPYA